MKRCSCTPVLSLIWSLLWRSNTLYMPLHRALWGICSIWCSGIQGIYAGLGVDLPVDWPIWALMVNIWNCHSYQVADLWGVDLPGDLPNFWQDRVDPNKYLKYSIYEHKMVTKMFPSRCRFQIYFQFCSM